MCVSPVAGIYSSDKCEFDADVSIDESFASGTPKFSDEAFFHFTITELVSSYLPACMREWKGALRSVGTLAVQTVPTCYLRNRGCIKQKSNLKRRPSSASEIREKMGMYSKATTSMLFDKAKQTPFKRRTLPQAVFSSGE